MSNYTQGWTRLRPGIYEKTINGLRYEILRYAGPTGNSYPMWIVHGIAFNPMPAYYILRDAQKAAHRHAEDRYE